MVAVTSGLGQVLKERGISQTWLCDELGVTPTRMHRWFWGREPIPDEMARAAVKAINRFPKVRLKDIQG